MSNKYLIKSTWVSKEALAPSAGRKEIAGKSSIKKQ